MQVTRTYRFDGTLARVLDVVADRTLYDNVAARSRALSHTVEIATEADGRVRADLRRELPTDNVPSSARSFVGSTITVIESTWWGPAVVDGPTAHSDGRFEVLISGTPVTMRGTIRLTEFGGEVTQVIDGELKAAVPFVGKKIEAAVEPVIVHQLDIVAELVGTALAQR